MENVLSFNGREYTYRQYRELREDDDSVLAPVFDWFSDSKVGEFTRHYNYTIFHAEDDTFICAYSDNLSNYWSV